MKQKLQAELSREWLTDALFDLMENNEYELITIKNLTEKAGVSRLTFYRHFESKDSILLAHMERVFNKYYSEILNNNTMDLKKALKLCFVYWKNDERAVRLLVKHKLTNLLTRAFNVYIPIILEMNLLPFSINRLQRKFLEGGLLSTMIDWLMYPNQSSEEDISNMIIDIVSLRIIQENR